MFNLYFAGNKSGYVEAYMESLWDKRLFSFWTDQFSILSRVQRGLHTFMDSGAFTAHTQGITIDVDSYLEFVNTYDDFLDLIAQVDTIPGVFRQPKSEADFRDAPEQTWKNYLYMRERIHSPQKLIAVFHQGEDIRFLRRMLAEGVPYIGVSPANDKFVTTKTAWIDKVFEVIHQTGRKDVKTHGFGITHVETLEQYPFTSADSATWMRAAIFGGIRTPYGIVNVSDKMKKKPDHISYLSAEQQEKVIQYLEGHGFNMLALKRSYRERMRACICYYVEWAKQYTYQNRRTVQRTFGGGY